MSQPMSIYPKMKLQTYGPNKWLDFTAGNSSHKWVHLCPPLNLTFITISMSTGSSLFPFIHIINRYLAQQNLSYPSIQFLTPFNASFQDGMWAKLKVLVNALNKLDKLLPIAAIFAFSLRMNLPYTSLITAQWCNPTVPIVAIVKFDDWLWHWVWHRTPLPHGMGSALHSGLKWKNVNKDSIHSCNTTRETIPDD